VPPLVTGTAVPFQIPDVIVPIVAKLEAEVKAFAVVSPANVVIKGNVVVDISIFPVFKAEKLLFIVVLEEESVSEPAIVIIVVPNFCVGVSKYDKGRYL
jgi:hypothetical protein